MRVQKSEAEDVLDIAADVKRMLATYQAPPGIDIAVWDDQTEVLEDRLNLLIRNGVLGFALVFLFLVVMLDLRLAMWVAMGVPISFLGAFLFFDFFDVNVNMVSLFALIIVLGIVVDDAVVVGENIVAEQEAGGRGTARRHRRRLGRPGAGDDSACSPRWRPSRRAVRHRHLWPDPGSGANRGHHGAVDVAGGGVLHPARAPLARHALEPLAAGRLPEPALAKPSCTSAT